MRLSSRTQFGQCVFTVEYDTTETTLSLRIVTLLLHTEN